MLNRINLTLQQTFSKLFQISLSTSLGPSSLGSSYLTRSLTIFIYCGAPSKESSCQSRSPKRRCSAPWVGKIPWRRAWQPTPVFLPGESHGQRSLAGYSPWGRKESDTAERLSTVYTLTLTAFLSKQVLGIRNNKTNTHN